MRETLIIGF